jgi:hypothetical protein
VALVDSIPRVYPNMDFPGLEVKKMTDDELMRKVSELHGKLVYSYSFSASQQLVQQIQAMLETLEFEQQDRASKRMWDLQQRRSPSVIESDPDLIEKKEVVQSTKKTTRTGISGGGLLKRSKTPSSDQT